MTLLSGESLSILVSYLLIFLAGVAIGYGIRAVISWRRRVAARQRYIATGSYRRLA